MAKAFVDIIGRDQTSAAFNSIDSRIGACFLQVGTLVKSFGFLAVAGGVWDHAEGPQAAVEQINQTIDQCEAVRARDAKAEKAAAKEARKNT